MGREGQGEWRGRGNGTEEGGRGRREMGRGEGGRREERELRKKRTKGGISRSHEGTERKGRGGGGIQRNPRRPAGSGQWQSSNCVRQLAAEPRRMRLMRPLQALCVFIPRAARAATRGFLMAPG